MRTLALTPLAGLVSGGLGLGAGHLAAALTRPSTSPLLAVGSTVIDRTPTSLKEWAIAHFGTHDKEVLLGSVLVVVLLVAAGIGLLAARSWVAGEAGLLALSAVSAACVLTRPAAHVADVMPTVVTAVVAGACLALLTGQIRRVETVGGRRAVLWLGAAAAVALAAGETGRRIAAYRGRPEAVTLPAPASPAPALPAGIERLAPGVSPFRTPTGSFYRVDTRLDVPVVSTSDWTLRIDGDVRRPFTIDFAGLLAMPLIERDITLTCVSNSVGGPYVGSARWLGVRLGDLLDRAGYGRGADQILSTDVDGMTISTPLALATDGRDAMVAVGMNGAPLPREHGFPARLVIPGLYGFISATKWVTRLTLTTYAAQSAYWTQRGWATDAPIRISSRIDTPRALAQLHAGEVVVGGVAWAQENGGVARVELQVDGGPWRPAHLGPSGGNDYWRQWYARWEATPGTHTLSCRVTDGAGQVQSPVRRTPYPSGASGIQSILVTVA